MKNNSNDIERVKLIVERIQQSGVDLTADYNDWVTLGFSFASMGEDGREYFQAVSAMNPNYSREECDRKFDNILSTNEGRHSIATFVQMAKDHNIDVKLASGRKKSESTGKTVFDLAADHLSKKYSFRFNVWTKRPESFADGKWKQVDDHFVDNEYIDMQFNHIKIKKEDLRTLLNSSRIAPEVDEVNNWLDSLPKWTPAEGEDITTEHFLDDPIAEMFQHIQVVDTENQDFYLHMMRKWFVGQIGFMRGVIDENHIMLVITGPQGLGKTHVARRTIPPELRAYQAEIRPNQKMNNDFEISMSEKIQIFLDEFSFSNNGGNNIHKQIISSRGSYVRDAYGHYRENRVRRAALIATTNDKQYIPEKEGSRRYLSVDCCGTLNTNQYPIPYERAYAQGLWLLEHGFNPQPNFKESEQITEHNKDFMIQDNLEELIKTYVRASNDHDEMPLMTAGQVLVKFRNMGIYGDKINANAIGKVLTQQGYEKIKAHGMIKYRIVIKSHDEIVKENKNDSTNINDDKANDATQYDLPF